MYVHMFTHLYMYVCDPSGGIGRGVRSVWINLPFKAGFSLKIANYLSDRNTKRFKYNSLFKINVVKNPYLHMHIMLIILYSNQVPLKLFISYYTQCSVELYWRFFMRYKVICLRLYSYRLGTRST